ncbi:MAG: polysaccharide pyruvyl transferase family protein [Campylobacteraceae bacterium]|nr:polysaccharide pyruvyl transferase family protein [Campylobacteraceae bacterium]
MKIAYFINTFKSTNWGGQATSNGIKYLLSEEYPDADFVPIDLPDLPFKKIKILRIYHDISLLNSLLKNDEKNILRILKKVGIPENFFDDFTHVCFNGEGAIHYKSGHLVRFMGLLYLAKLKNKYVASVNQTIDLGNNQKLEKLVSTVYNMCDFVSVREPISFELAHKIGIKNPHLIPDAVYGLPKIENKEIVVKKFNLTEQFITITGSSALKRDKKSINKMDKVLKYIKKIFRNTPMVFMVNAKTDFFIAKKLKNKYDLKIINSADTNYEETMAIFAKSILLIGGRQHPNIFAYIYKVPYIAFDGNTFKNEGVGRLQDYPIKPLHWDTSFEKFSNAIDKVFNNKIEFKDIKINDFKIL